MSIKYFLVAILFVLFDVEVIFMYPWAVNFRDLGKRWHDRDVYIYGYTTCRLYLYHKKRRFKLGLV
jgi:NADH:ubiquinone oxidoreductase subunit 3 (subunit A)